MNLWKRNGRLWARVGFDPIFGVCDGLQIEWTDGVITGFQERSKPSADMPREACFDRHILTAGLLNAHVHLDYSFLRGQLPQGQGFVVWLRQMMQHAAAGRDANASCQPQQQAAAGAVQELLSEGVCHVCDISSFGWAREALETSGMNGMIFQEWLAPRLCTWDQAWQGWLDHHGRRMEQSTRSGAKHARGCCSGHWVDGISPHAPYSVCPPALERAAAWARGAGVPLAIHLGESPEERELLEQGSGELWDLLSLVGGCDRTEDLGKGPSAIARAQQAGALGEGWLAIHCNQASRGDAQRLAASRATVVFCPRSHAFFGYSPYPLAEYEQAGVRLALGTDSLASNHSLSIRAETAELARLAPRWEPTRWLGCATGAQSGLWPGRLQKGIPACWALWEPQDLPSRPWFVRDVFEAWAAPATRCVASSAGWGKKTTGA